MAAASDAFGRASALLPTFASAAANWGATLGELDRPEEALAAFTRALAADPANAQAVNNVGVVTRELGRLGESEAAFRRVIALTPDLAFGHYNLGHTLFLQGRYQASLSAYAAGQRKDPARNPVQASRLALARLATGDAAGALRELQGCTATLPRDYRRQLLGDTHAVAWALLSAAPDLPRLARRRRLAGGGAGQAVVWRAHMDERTHTAAASSTTRGAASRLAAATLLDDRGIRLAAGLAVVVAIPVAVLFYFQFQSINDLASTSAVVLRQLSQETADAAANDVEDTLKRPHIGVLLGVPQARTDALDRAWMDPVFQQGLEQSPFVEAFYVWSAVSPQQANTMLVYNRDSLADVSGDLDRRFRDAPGVAAVDPAAAAAAARTQARHRGVSGHHRRPPQVRAGAAALPQSRSRHASRASLRSPSMPRPSAPCTSRRMMKARLATRAAPGRLPAARPVAARRRRAR